MMLLWCYDDAHNWGQKLAEVATTRGHDARLFAQPFRAITSGNVFLHMHSHPAVRLHHKRMAQTFAINPDIKLVPNYRLASLYDDKLEQLRQLSKWMPPTRVFTSPQQARDFIDSVPPLPIMSKSGEGSGVRVLRSLDDMQREVKLAFSDLGIKNRFGGRHHGYLYWQKHLGEHDFVVRVVCIGAQRLLVRRGNRKGSADRTNSPVTHLDAEAESALTFANEIIAAERFNFGALDLIPVDGEWKLLKLTVGWHMARYADATMFYDGRKASSVWEAIIDEMEKGNL